MWFLQRVISAGTMRVTNTLFLLSIVQIGFLYLFALEDTKTAEASNPASFLKFSAVYPEKGKD